MRGQGVQLLLTCHLVSTRHGYTHQTNYDMPCCLYTARVMRGRSIATDMPSCLYTARVLRGRSISNNIQHAILTLHGTGYERAFNF
ncbi:hypothetical protein J6590_026501 [Homalodisca vitripennis]|nr:hypothetical protein J6590_026501 [Homalodisca vitripennis]